MKCPKCNSKINVFVDGRNNIVKCEKCDYEVVTTYTEPIKLDNKKYKITILDNEYTLEQTRIFSKIFGFNYIEGKRKLCIGNYTFEGFAEDILQKKSALECVNINYKIVPNFNY